MLYISYNFIVSEVQLYHFQGSGKDEDLLVRVQDSVHCSNVSNYVRCQQRLREFYVFRVRNILAFVASGLGNRAPMEYRQ